MTVPASDQYAREHSSCPLKGDNLVYCPTKEWWRNCQAYFGGRGVIFGFGPYLILHSRITPSKLRAAGD